MLWNECNVRLQKKGKLITLLNKKGNICNSCRLFFRKSNLKLFKINTLQLKLQVPGHYYNINQIELHKIHGPVRSLLKFMNTKDEQISATLHGYIYRISENVAINVESHVLQYDFLCFVIVYSQPVQGRLKACSNRGPPEMTVDGGLRETRSESPL